MSEALKHLPLKVVQLMKMLGEDDDLCLLEHLQEMLKQRALRFARAAACDIATLGGRSPINNLEMSKLAWQGLEDLREGPVLDKVVAMYVQDQTPDPIGEAPQHLRKPLREALAKAHLCGQPFVTIREDGGWHHTEAGVAAWVDWLGRAYVNDLIETAWQEEAQAKMPPDAQPAVAVEAFPNAGDLTWPDDFEPAQEPGMELCDHLVAWVEHKLND